MRWPAALAVSVVMAAGACFGDDGLTPVRAYAGFLDCPTAQFSASMGSWDPDTPKAPFPEAALAELTPEFGRPPGTPRVETAATDAVSYLFTDEDGHRLGRAGVVLTPGGWIVATTERCA